MHELIHWRAFRDATTDQFKSCRNFTELAGFALAPTDNALGQQTERSRHLARPLVLTPIPFRHRSYFRSLPATVQLRTIHRDMCRNLRRRVKFARPEIGPSPPGVHAQIRALSGHFSSRPHHVARLCMNSPSHGVSLPGRPSHASRPSTGSAARAPRQTAVSGSAAVASGATAPRAGPMRSSRGRQAQRPHGPRHRHRASGSQTSSERPSPSDRVAVRARGNREGERTPDEALRERAEPGSHR